MCSPVELTCTTAFVSNVDWRLCEEQRRGFAPHLKQPWAWNSKFTHLPLPWFLFFCPTTRGPTFLSFCTNGLVTIISFFHSSAPPQMLSPNHALEPSERTGGPPSQTHHLRRQVKNPLLHLRRLLDSYSRIRSFHHTSPQVIEMLYRGEFLFSTHHWGDM